MLLVKLTKCKQVVLLSGTANVWSEAAAYRMVQGCHFKNFFVEIKGTYFTYLEQNGERKPNYQKPDNVGKRLFDKAQQTVLIELCILCIKQSYTILEK